jgi:hypothetical protein
MQGDVRRHRQIGRVGAYLTTWMVIVGFVITPLTVMAGRVPPFFSPAAFLALDWVNIVCFGGLVSMVPATTALIALPQVQALATRFSG